METSQGSQSKLIGGVNPFEKHAGQIGSFPPAIAVKHKKCLKPPTRKQIAKKGLISFSGYLRMMNPHPQKLYSFQDLAQRSEVSLHFLQGGPNKTGYKWRI